MAAALAASESAEVTIKGSAPASDTITTTTSTDTEVTAEAVTVSPPRITASAAGTFCVFDYSVLKLFYAVFFYRFGFGNGYGFGSG